MTRRRSILWWSWLLIELALALEVAGWTPGVWIAMAIAAQQALHLALSSRATVSLAVQVRLAYLGVLALGLWPPLAVLHLAQLAGTTILLAFDYCLASRLLSLLPWNREGPLTLRRVAATFLTPPGQLRIG